MPKALEICNCKECPNCVYEDTHDYYYCNLNFVVIASPYDEIPEWCPLPEIQRNDMLDWKMSGEELPEILEDVLAYNADTRQLEFGFRSEIDTDPIHWADFSFPVTHWAYCNLPE